MNHLSRRATIVALGLAGAALVTVPGLLGGYGQFIVTAIAYMSIIVVAVSMLAGLTGIWSLGHMSFVAFGAYLAANLSAVGVPVEGIIVLAFIGSGILGFVLGLSAGRFSVLYFGLLTMALSLASSEVIGHWSTFTGGDEGIAVAPGHVWLFGIGGLGLQGAAVMSIVMATAVFLLADAVAHGNLGRRWLAVKGQRVASAAIGLRPPLENAKAFSLSAAMASLGGIGMAYSISYLDPVGFDLHAGVLLLVATVVGGAGSLLGSLMGAAFIVAVPEAARSFPTVSNFVFGIATVLTLLFLRKGVVPSLAAYVGGLLRPDRGKGSAEEKHAFDADSVAAMVRELLVPARDDLVVENVSVRFGGVKALDSVRLSVPAGSCVGLIGPNGAGKTTMLNVLSGFYRATSRDALRIGSIDLASLPTDRRVAAGFGRTFQHAELFSELTLREMLMMTAELGRKRRAEIGAAEMSAAALADKIIDGLNLRRFADMYPEELPFGIQKVADVGRVLATGASIVAMDEPMAGLDAEERNSIRTILRGMRSAGVSILIIDHAVQEVLDVSDRVVVFEFGKLLVEGEPAEVRAHPEVLRAYFGTTDASAATKVIHA